VDGGEHIDKVSAFSAILGIDKVLRYRKQPWLRCRSRGRVANPSASESFSERIRQLVLCTTSYLRAVDDALIDGYMIRKIR
jgi:hypothetical protein